MNMMYLDKYIILNIKTKLNPSRAEKYALIWHIFLLEMGIL